MAIVQRGHKVVGGITYRPFPHRTFAEIVFFAIASVYQVNVSMTSLCIVIVMTAKFLLTDPYEIGVWRAFDESLQGTYQEKHAIHNAFLGVCR
jgi:hypothetical protein